MIKKRIGVISFLLLVVFSVADRYLHPNWKSEQLNLEQAKSFLQGDLSIEVADQDTAIFNGKYFIPYPPTPALVFLPAVALVGPHPAIPYIISALALVLIAFILFKIARHFDLSEELSSLFCFGAIFGTGLWMCLQYSFSATYNSHILAALFVLAGIYEAIFKKRAWLIGIYLSAACTTRPFTMTSGLFMLALLWMIEHRSIKEKIKDIALIGLGALPLGLFAMWFNYSRFGDALNLGYAYIAGSDFTVNSLFDFRIIPRNIYVMFLRGPNMDILLDRNVVTPAFEFPFGILGSDIGTSLTFASPFLLYAFFASFRNRVVLAGSLAILFNLIPVLCYVALGLFQLNSARYAIDFLPILFLLTLMGLKNRKDLTQPFQFLIKYSIVLNVLFLTPILAWLIRQYIQFVIFLRT